MKLYYLPRTAIEAEILFAARVMQVRFLGAVIKPVHPCTGLIARFAQQNALLLRTTDIRVGTEKKTPPEQNSSGKKIEAESAVLHFVFFEVIVNKMQQSAKERCFLKRNTVPEVFPLPTVSGKTMPFEKRRSRYKETAENKAEAYRVYVEHLFLACDAVDARIFSKGDGIDRVINTLLPDGSEQKNEYAIEDNLQITKAIDPLENTSVTKKDARGNIREVERLDKNGTVLTKGRYEYSVLGEMLRAYDAHENIVSVTYDLLGRRVALESKDTGRKEWRYDSKGLLEAESDSLLRSKLSEIQYHYDGFDRLIKIDYPFSTDVEYTYGQAGQAGAGEIVEKRDESGEIHYEYGRLSEVIEETRTIKRYEALSTPETATFTYRSDYLGRMQTMRYPDGEVITYTYDKGGQLKGVSGVKNTVKGTETYSYIDTIVYDEHGQRVYIKYGNGVETCYRYDDKRRWLKDIETKNRQTDEIFQKISYRFDKVGNVLGYSNDASVYETSQSYTYDSLYQLIGVEGTSNQYKAIKSFGSTPVNVAKYKQDFAFDGIGNMTKKMSTTNLPGARGNAYPKAELDYSLDYEYDPAYAHRLIHAGNRYYRYDANGNITAEKDGPFTEDDEFIFTYNYDPDTDVYGADYGFGLDAPKETEETRPENLFAYRRNYTWNEKNLLTKSSDRSYTVHYRYGEDGQRALKYTEEGRSETLYFNNFYTIHIPVQDKNNPQGLRVHKHIFVGNSRLVTAMTHTDNNGDNAEQREKRYYYHSDHLGSAQFVTDWKGKQYEHIEYTPYGELWIEEVAAGLDKLPFRFTGKEMDEETGLYYYGARYLDPKYSRWLSGDPALGDYIPKAPIDDEAKKHNENLPSMGGVFNVVNLHLYHYAGNNPVKYTDPDGRSEELGSGASDHCLVRRTDDGKYVIVDGGNQYNYMEENKTVKGGTLTVKEIAAIVFNETRSLSGEKVGQARKEVAHAIINADKKWGEKRDRLAGTAPKTANPPEAEKTTYDACMQIVKGSVKEDEDGIDPTNGAFFFNFRKTDSTSDFQGKKNHTSTGPLNNSYSDYKYANTYGD